MILVLFCFHEIDEKIFKDNAVKITNNIKHATHVIIKKESDKDFNIINIETFYKEAKLYVITILRSLLKDYAYDNLMWEMATIVIKNITLSEKSNLELNESIDRLCDKLSNISCNNKIKLEPSNSDCNNFIKVEPMDISCS